MRIFYGDAVDPRMMMSMEGMHYVPSAHTVRSSAAIQPMAHSDENHRYHLLLERWCSEDV